MSTAIVDGTYVLNRSVYTDTQQLTHDGIYTGGLLMYINQLTKIKGMVDNIVICLDKGKCEWRYEIYPEYKASRRTKEVDLEAKRRKDITLDFVKQFCVFTGIPIIEIDGWEGDDLVAKLALHLKKNGETVIAVSDDSDYFQLVNYNIPVFRTYKEETITQENFESTARIGKVELDFDPEFFTLFLAIAGTHNDVKGVPQVGPKRAKQLIKSLPDSKLSSLINHVLTHEDLPSRKVRSNLSIVKRNLSLIDFFKSPLDESEVVNLYNSQKTNTKRSEAAIAFLSQLGFKEIPNWI